MKCCMHYHSMGIIKIYFGKSPENLKKLFWQGFKITTGRVIPPTDIFFRMDLIEDF